MSLIPEKYIAGNKKILEGIKTAKKKKKKKKGKKSLLELNSKLKKKNCH